METTTPDLDSPSTARRTCSGCGTTYWADRFDLCPDCDGAYLTKNCGEKYAAHARRERDHAQLVLSQIHAPEEAAS
jgi:hypothetical protein